MNSNSVSTSDPSQARQVQRSEAPGSTRTDLPSSDNLDPLAGVSSDPCVGRMDVSEESNLVESLTALNVQGAHASGTTGGVTRALPNPNSSQVSNLLEAVKQNDVSKVKDPNLKNAAGDTPLHIAIMQGDIESVTRLLAHKDIRVDEKNGDGYTGLHLAVCNLQHDILQALLDAGVDPNIKGPDDYTALGMAVLNMHNQCVEVLSKHPKTNLNETYSSSDRTALHEAVEAKNSQALATLLNSGADPNVKDCFETTPLFKAIDRSDIQAVQRLVWHSSIDINVRCGADGSTALHLAVFKRQIRFQELLLKAGFKHYVTDNKGNTPFVYVMREFFESEGFPSIQNEESIALFMGTRLREPSPNRALHCVAESRFAS